MRIRKNTHTPLPLFMVVDKAETRLFPLSNFALAIPPSTIAIAVAKRLTKLTRVISEDGVKGKE